MSTSHGVSIAPPVVTLQKKKPSRKGWAKLRRRTSSLQVVVVGTAITAVPVPCNGLRGEREHVRIERIDDGANLCHVRRAKDFHAREVLDAIRSDAG